MILPIDDADIVSLHNELKICHNYSISCKSNITLENAFVFLLTYIRDDHQNLKLLSIDLNQMHLIGLVERTILVFKSSKSDVLLQSYGL